MREELRTRYRAYLDRIRRFERREVGEFRRWIEHTGNLLHLSVLLFVPLLIAFVTFLSNHLRELSFLLFPPLASGTYTLFSDPEGPYSSPRKFVGGMTAGAVCGWIAIEIAAIGIYGVDPASLRVDAPGAALAILLTAAVTWALDLEEPTAFSTALLTLVTGTTEGTLLGTSGGSGTSAFLYVVSVVLSSSLVSIVFLVWREQFYDRRARYLYQSTKGDDHVLVPVRSEMARTTAMFAARLAAAHDAGKVVLLDVVDPDSIEEAEEELSEEIDEGIARGTVPEGAEAEVEELAEEQVGEEAGRNLERLAAWITTKVGVPCEVVVAADGTTPSKTVVDAARETNCDLIVTPFEEERGALSKFTRKLFRSDVDVVAFRSDGERTRWRRVMVPVRKAGDVAHAMIDFAGRISGRTGRISVCHCISRNGDRRPAETMLSNLVETFDGRVETRVSRSSIMDFLEANGPSYDLVIMGASTDRTTASRFVSPPTFERLHEVDCDVAIVHRA